MEANLKTLIIRQIKEVFGQKVKVYDEPVKQGLETPSFIVLIVEDESVRKLGKASEWEFFVNVTYFPESETETFTECDKVSQIFKENFRYIGDKFHVNRLKASKSDSTLVITFAVKKQVFEILEDTKMGSLNYGGVTSGEGD